MRLLVRLVPLLPLCSAAKQCYFPNGNLAPDYPCDPSADESPCCGVTAVCLTNKLCRTPEMHLIRGTCTDKNWNSPQCAQFCLSLQDGGEDLIPCSNVTGTSNTEYCCISGPRNCCDSGVARFAVLPANPQPWAKWDASASSVVVLLQQTSSSSSSSQTSSTASNAGTTTSSTTTTTTTTTTPTTGEATNPPSSSSGESGLPVAAQAGIGVGVVVVFLLLAALGFLLRKLQQKNRALQLERQRTEAMMGQGAVAQPAVVELGRSGSKYMLDGTPRSEMDGGIPGYEGYGYGELDGASRPSGLR